MSRITPYKLVVALSVSLILGGVVLMVQGVSFIIYQVGFVVIIVGALLQIIMGNMNPESTWLQALRVFLIGLAIFLAIVLVSIRTVPLIYRWL